MDQWRVLCFKPEIFKYLENDMDQMMWEDDPLEQLTA
jgi:hypothetical protein